MHSDAEATVEDACEVSLTGGNLTEDGMPMDDSLGMTQSSGRAC